MKKHLLLAALLLLLMPGLFSNAPNDNTSRLVVSSSVAFASPDPPPACPNPPCLDGKASKPNPVHDTDLGKRNQSGGSSSDSLIEFGTRIALLLAIFVLRSRA
jgi:hypothetical protein